MKKIYLLTVLFCFTLVSLFAQSPNSFKYQAMVRNDMDEVLSEQTVGLRLSLRAGDAMGNVEYSETHSPTTSSKGIFSLNIGTGQVETGSFLNLDWANEEYWLEVEMDIAGGSNYKYMGTSQLVSVPYALHAQTVSDKNDADADPANELQQLSFNSNNNELSISGGNSITIPSGGTDADADPSNELQNLTLLGQTLEISNGNQVDLSLIATPWEPASWGGIVYDKDLVYTDMQQVESYVRVGNNSPSSTKLEPEGLYVDHYNGDGSTADLIGKSLKFETKDDIHTWASYGLDSLVVTSGNIWPGFSIVKPNEIFLGSGLNENEMTSYSSRMTNILDDTELSLSSWGIRMDTVDAFGEMDFNQLTFGSDVPLEHHVQLNKDSLEFFKDNPGLLFDSKSELNADKIEFEYGGEYAALDAFTLFMDNTAFRTWYSPFGIQNEEIISPFESFLRFSLSPDSLVMKNAGKWSTVRLGTSPQNQAGELRLYGIGNETHSYMGYDGFGGGMIELNYGDKQRIGMWSFEDNGLINTLGKNGFENAYIGAANLHNNPNMGGMGVMSDAGIIKAGIEVSGTNEGVVYANGEIQVLDDDFKIASLSDFGGYTLFNPANNDMAVSLFRDFFEHSVGYLTLGGASSNNVFAGPNWDYGGNANTGMVEVSNADGFGKAGMYVFSNGESALYADQLNIGEKPIGPSTYPMNLQQKENFGLNLVSVDGTQQNWELYVTDNGNLGLYTSNGLVGSFSDIDGAYTQSSDRNLKTNISSLSTVLASIMKLDPSAYNYFGRETSPRKSIGFIAQDVQKIFPELVQENIDKDGKSILSVNYTGFSVLAIKAIQEQQQVISKQEKKITDLEYRLARIEALLSESD